MGDISNEQPSGKRVLGGNADAPPTTRDHLSGVYAKYSGLRSRDLDEIVTPLRMVISSLACMGATKHERNARTDEDTSW